MFKSTLFFIMTFMMCLSAGARSYVRNHEDFVHLSEYQKNQYIIKVMELVVELESKYKFEVKKYGYSQDRFEKYQNALRKVASLFFIESAHAQARILRRAGERIGDGINAAMAAPQAFFPASVRHSDWNGLATRFSEILNNPAVSEGNRCIFAGWISETAIGEDGKTYCNHPVRMERPARGYPNPVEGSGCSRNDTSQIQCNPLIFGYKNAVSHSLFCVSTDDRAKNSSYHCMEKALGTVTEEGADSRGDRLAALRNNLASNPTAFNGVQEFVYRTCVCDSSHENFSQAYQDAIRPHRTCYGLMNMIGETISCENPRLPLEDHSIFQSLKNFMVNKSISESNADGHYSQFLNELRKDTAEYRRICQIPQETPETPEVVNYLCESVTCPEGATQCDYVVKISGQDTAVTFSERPTEMPPAAGGSFPITFKVADLSGTATCEAPVPTPTDEYVCVAECLIAAPASSGNGQADEAETADPATNPSAPPADPEGETAATPEVPGCNITSLKNSSGQDVANPEIVQSPEVTSAGVATLSFKLKIDNVEKDVSCSTSTRVIGGTTTTDTNTDDDNNETTTDTAPTLTVVIKKKNQASYDIEATTTNDTDWLFQWKSTPPEGKTVEDSWSTTTATEDTVTVAGDSGEETSSETETTAAPESHGKSITQQRYDFNYNVCGTLTKTGKDPIEKCVVVDKLGSENARNQNRFPNVNPNLQPGGGAPRGTSDTSAIGIR